MSTMIMKLITAWEEEEDEDEDDDDEEVGILCIAYDKNLKLHN